MVVLGRKLLKETISTVYKTLARLITAVCEQNGHGGIDEQEAQRRGRKRLFRICALHAEHIMIAPIRGYMGAQYVFGTGDGVAVHEVGEAGLATAIKAYELGDAYVREVLGTQTKETPQPRIHRL